MRKNLCATNSSDPNTGVEIIVPGLGLLLEQYPLADRPISLSARRALSFGQEAGIRTRTVRFTGGDAAVTPQSWEAQVHPVAE